MKRNSPLLLILFLLASIGCQKKNADVTEPNPPAQLAVVETLDITAIKETSASSGGKITSDGGASITSRGICWSTKGDPSITDSKTTEGSGIGSFNSAMSALTNGSVYKVRAYATNSIGTAYGKTQTFVALLIGQAYLGGFLAYILQEGDPGYAADKAHGLIVSATTSFVEKWSQANYTLTNANGTALGTGNANTATIVATLGAGSYAARTCFDAKQLEYSDWYLPSKDEVYKLYVNRNLIGGAPHTGYMWTSSEVGTTSAWIQAFDTGAQSTYDKNGSGFMTRAMRSF